MSREIKATISHLHPNSACTHGHWRSHCEICERVRNALPVGFVRHAAPSSFGDAGTPGQRSTNNHRLGMFPGHDAMRAMRRIMTDVPRAMPRAVVVASSSPSSGDRLLDVVCGVLVGLAAIGLLVVIAVVVTDLL